MTPYYSEAGIELYHGDCRKVLPTLPVFDLLLTDPPYGLGERMQGGTWGSAEKYADLRRWDVLPDAETVRLILGAAKHSIIWGGNNLTLPPSRAWLAWDKQNAVRTMADVELAWTNCDRPAKRFSWPVGVHSFGHPSEKPVELFGWCISLFPQCASVIDPYFGSGSSLVAAKIAGLRAVGVEVNERYCEIAANRLRQGVLFGAEVRPA